MLGEPVPSGNVAGEAIIVVTSAAIIVLGLLKILERRDAFAWQLWLQAALALGTTPLVWADLYSYGRVLGLLYFAFGLMVLTSPRRAHLLPARLHEWTMPVPDATKCVNRVWTAITSRNTPAFFTVKRSERLS
jgi:hypothetical protein